MTEITHSSVAAAPDGRVTTITRDANGNPTTRIEDGFEAGAPFGPLHTVPTELQKSVRARIKAP